MGFWRSTARVVLLPVALVATHRMYCPNGMTVSSTVAPVWPARSAQGPAGEADCCHCSVTGLTLTVWTVRQGASLDGGTSLNTGSKAVLGSASMAMDAKVSFDMANFARRVSMNTAAFEVMIRAGCDGFSGCMYACDTRRVSMEFHGWSTMSHSIVTLVPFTVTFGLTSVFMAGFRFVRCPMRLGCRWIGFDNDSRYNRCLAPSGGYSVQFGADNSFRRRL